MAVSKNLCRSFVALLGLALTAVLAFPLFAYGDEGALGAATVSDLQAAGAPADDGVALFRLYNPYSGEHFYTEDAAERDYLAFLGWHYEGVGWYAPRDTGDPVYRLYNPNAGDHHYTLDAGERDHLVSVGWIFEGVGWCSPSAGEPRLGLYREYNPNARSGAHNFTTDGDEHAHLVSLGWRPEGLGWYALPQSAQLADGWIREGDSWRLYRGGRALANQWVVTAVGPPIACAGGLQRYWIDASGALACGRMVDPSNSLDSNAGYKAYAEWDGRIARNTYRQFNGAWYRLDNDGAIQSDTVVNRLYFKAQAYSSPSRYLIMVDIDDPRTVVFEGSRGRWSIKYVMDCCTGAPHTPTVQGVYRVGMHGYSFGEDKGYSCYYWTQFYGNYLFHTRKYYPHSSTLKDGTMGARVSEGCVRLYDEDAKWIYYNVPVGTTVVTTV